MRYILFLLSFFIFCSLPVSAQKKTVSSYGKAVFKCSVLEKIRMAVFYAYESPTVRTADR